MLKSRAIRVTAAIVLAFAAGACLTQLDGQVFRNSLVFLGLAIPSVWIWVREALRRESSRASRYFCTVMGTALSVAVVWVAVQLPEAYRFQRSFNSTVQDVFEHVGRQVGKK